MSFSCLECGNKFPSERSLHTHLKAHGMYLAEYYCKHFPRHDLLTGEAIQFKQKDEYLAAKFSCRENMLEWLSASNEAESRELLIEMLRKRIKDKKLSAAPTEVELFFAHLPPIKEYKRLFGSYTKACQLVNSTPALCGKLPNEWANDFSKKKIYFDSREQKPLQFANSECLKLDVGDYSVGGNDFKNTFVDRKSFEDLCGTLVNDNLERFRREIIRAQTQDCFLWVVVECELERVFELAKLGKHKPNMFFIGHNIRLLQSEFGKNVQFIFSGSRENSELIIPKLLCLGNKLWNVDMQYFIGGFSHGVD